MDRFSNIGKSGRGRSRRVQSKHGKDNKMANSKKQRAIGMAVKERYNEKIYA